MQLPTNRCNSIQLIPFDNTPFCYLIYYSNIIIVANHCRNTKTKNISGFSLTKNNEKLSMTI